MKHYKAIFLDWDNTIGDWTTAEHKALQDIYQTYRLNRLYDTFEDYLNAYKPYNLEFTHTLISEEVGINKPQPQIFHIALQRNGITADQAIMIGDSYSSDIAGAKAAGIDQVWIHQGDAEDTATYIVPTLADVLKIV